MPSKSTTRSEKLDLRLTLEAKNALKAAAAIAHRSVSDFVLESALAKDNEMLAERQTFALDARRWSMFLAALDAPPRDLPRMARLLQEPGLFDGDANR